MFSLCRVVSTYYSVTILNDMVVNMITDFFQKDK